MRRILQAIISLLTVVVVVLPIAGCGGYAAQFKAERTKAAELNLPKGTRLKGPEIITILSNAIIYGSFVTNNITWVEHFSDYENGYGDFVVQFSQLVQYPSSTGTSFKGRWEVNGDLLCTSINTGKDKSCVEVYLKEDNLQFFDPVYAAIYAVTTRVELSPKAWEIVNSKNTKNMAKKKSLPAITGAAPPETAPTFPSKPIDVRFRPSKPRQHDIAVIIGNADYKKLGRDIPNVTPAYADAEGIKRYFMNAKGVREGNIIHLKDATGTQLTGVFGNKENHKGQLFNWVKTKRLQRLCLLRWAWRTRR